MAARAGLADLVTRLRTMVDDAVSLYVEQASGDGSNKVFFLQNIPVYPDSQVVSIGGTVQGTALYTLDNATGKLTFTTAPAIGTNNIEVEYKASDFTDDEFQDIFDRGRTDLHVYRLEEVSIRVAGGTEEWHDYYAKFANFEKTTGGTSIFVVRDSSGSIIPSGSYTPNYVNGHINFPADQAGSLRYLDARSYDLYGGAGEVWRLKSAKTSSYYRFRADGHDINREQWHEHCTRMVLMFANLGKVKVIDMVREDAT